MAAIEAGRLAVDGFVRFVVALLAPIPDGQRGLGLARAACYCGEGSARAGA